MLKAVGIGFYFALFLLISGMSSYAAKTHTVIAQADPCNCNSTLRKRVAACNTIFPPASRSQEHTSCLQKARDEFDACRRAC